MIYQLITEPDPDAKHSLFVRPGDGDGPDGEGGATVEAQLVALFNIIFAYGGQFAFVELMTSMVGGGRAWAVLGGGFGWRMAVACKLNPCCEGRGCTVALTQSRVSAAS